MDRLIRRIQSALSPDLLKPEWRGNPNPLAGHCYVAAETLWHLAGKASGYRPYVVRVPEGTHWFLRDARGRILDPTAEQFDRTPDYASGRGCGFLTRNPSKRARILMDRL